MGNSPVLMDPKAMACEGEMVPLSTGEVKMNLRLLPNWHLCDARRSIQAEYRKKDFMDAAGCIPRIARIAGNDGQHLDIHLTGYRYLLIKLTTHAIGGLSIDDFILAAKLDKVLSK